MTDWTNIQEFVLAITDDRPLTDETLKELGFTQIEPNLWSNGEIKFGLYSGKAPIKVNITPVYKTVGGIKLLIEALKGEMK